MNRMYARIWFCTAVAFTAGFATASQPLQIVSKKFSLGEGRDMHIKSVTSTYCGLRKLHCAQKCISMKLCRSFSFYRQTKTCGLQTDGLHKNATVSEHGGPQHYYLRSEGCPENYIWNNKIKLCFKLYLQESKSFSSSKKECNLDHHRSRLAILDSDEKIGFIGSHVKPPYQLCVWVGAEREEDGEFRLWNDGSEISHNLWAKGEPNDPNAKCANLHHSSSFKLNDDNCNFNCNFVCEIP